MIRHRKLSATVLLAMGLSLFAISIADAQEFRHKPFLRVFDANGKKVGNVISIAGLDVPIVAFQTNGQIFVLAVVQTELAGSKFLEFQTGNCSGTPFLEAVNPSVTAPRVLPPVAISTPGRTVYLPDPGADIQTISVLSQQLLNGLCQQIAQTQRTVVPALPTVDLASLFAPPFTVR